MTKFCVVYKDPRHPKCSGGLVIDLSDPTPAMRYAWSSSPSIITAFQTEKEAQEDGIDKCGIAEYSHGAKILHIMPHPSKKYSDLRSLPALKV